MAKSTTNWTTVPSATKRLRLEREAAAAKKRKRTHSNVMVWSKKGQLVARSRRMKKLMAYYRELKSEFLAEHTVCAVHHDGHPNCNPIWIHHVHGKLGSLLLDARWWVPVCFSGHRFIEDNKAWAREKKLLCAKDDWNRAPEDAETKYAAMYNELLTKLTSK